MSKETRPELDARCDESNVPLQAQESLPSRVHSPFSVARGGAASPLSRRPPVTFNGGTERDNYSPTRSVMSPYRRDVRDGSEPRREGTNVDGESTTVGNLTVHPRFRHRVSTSQTGLSYHNCGTLSPTHSRMSSREQFSWDSQTWNNALPDPPFLNDPSKEYLCIAQTSGVPSHASPVIGPQKHVRSFAAWNKNDVETFGERSEPGAGSPLHYSGYIPPADATNPVTDGGYETAPLGHQQSFSLISHVDVQNQGTECGMPTSAPSAPVNNESTERMSRGPLMTHVLVAFKNLYGVYYVPQSEMGTFDVGDLVSVESFTGENTGKVIRDLTDVMRDDAARPEAIRHHPTEVLWPEDPAKALEATDPETGKLKLLRLPRVVRRGMNKGKKRLYYARRRDNEAYDVCQRLVREHSFNLNISWVEYQVDFKRITVFCMKDSSNASPSEMTAFTQQLTTSLRGSAVELIFSNDTPDALDVTRTITNGAFYGFYNEAMARMKEIESLQQQSQAHQQGQAQVQARVSGPSTQRAGCSAGGRAPICVPRPYHEASLGCIGHPPVVSMFGVPPTFPQPLPAMMTPLSMNQLYGMPPMPWGSPAPPPYIPPQMGQNAPERM
ncbi:hypothetical protein TRVL_08380 [Trypanosoma vivax]|nr:hypothetical protein TRVL_08380 [Trypanosoma vivax]